MKNLWLSSVLCVAAAGVGLAATGGDRGSKAKAEGGDCPAAALIAKWEKAAAQVAAMSAEKREAVSRAHATLAASCPVCKEAPASFAFLGRFLGTTVALDGLALASFEEGEKSGQREEIPADIRSAFEQRVAIGARGNELFLAFAKAAAPPGKAECGGAEGHKAAEAGAVNLTIAEAGRTFESSAEEASRLAGNWRLIPARAAALPAATKSELFAAMEVVKREVPTCELAKETLTVLAGGLDRLVALDKTLARHCEESSKAHAGDLPAEHAQWKKAFEARTRATAKVAELLRVMEQTMTPEIFQAAPAKAEAGRTY